MSGARQSERGKTNARLCYTRRAQLYLAGRALALMSCLFSPRTCFLLLPSLVTAAQQTTCSVIGSHAFARNCHVRAPTPRSLSSCADTRRSTSIRFKRRPFLKMKRCATRSLGDMLAHIASALLVYASGAYAAQAAQFVPPALTPTSSSSNYTGGSNGTLANSPVVPGKVFDRFIQVRRPWLPPHLFSLNYTRADLA